MKSPAPTLPPFLLILANRKTRALLSATLPAAFTLQLANLREASATRADAILVDASDEAALGQLDEEIAAASCSIPVIALARDSFEGLAAVRRGAEEWVLWNDAAGLCARIETCRARRVGRRAAGTPREVPEVERGDERSLVAIRDGSLRQIGVMLERRDLETKGHTDRVVKLSDRFARHLGLDSTAREALRWGAYLHDLGKLALPDRVLLKPGPLDQREMEMVREHPDIGCEMAEPLPYLPEGSMQVVRHHHERWDGGGYPHSLAGDEIPLLARIFGLVDVYDALLSSRPYKEAWPRERVLEEIEGEAGAAFDPALTAGFLELLDAPAPQSGPL